VLLQTTQLNTLQRLWAGRGDTFPPCFPGATQEGGCATAERCRLPKGRRYQIQHKRHKAISSVSFTRSIALAAGCAGVY